MLCYCSLQSTWIREAGLEIPALQVQSEPFCIRLGGLALCDVKSFLKSGHNFGLGTVCQGCQAAPLSQNHLKKSHTIPVTATHRCSNQKQNPSVPGSILMSHHKTQKGQEAHAISVCATRDQSTVKIEEQRPGKRGNVILKLAPPKDQTSAWELNYFLAVGRDQRRAECALYLSVEQMAPCNNCGPWPGGMGREVNSRGLSRPGCSCLVLEYLLHLKCFPVLVWLFLSFHSDSR